MALIFPQNNDVIKTDAGRFGNSFQRVWHGFFDALFRKVSAAEKVPSITLPNVGAAGAAYSQAYANEQTAMINELKSKLDALTTAIRT